MHTRIPDGHSAAAWADLIEIILSSQIAVILKLHLYGGGQTKQTMITAKTRIIYTVSGILIRKGYIRSLSGLKLRYISMWTKVTKYLNIWKFMELYSLGLWFYFMLPN